MEAGEQQPAKKSLYGLAQSDFIKCLPTAKNILMGAAKCI
jgi:hypothetical protein